MGRCVLTPLVKLNGQGPPSPRLLWYDVERGNEYGGEILAAFELYLVRKGLLVCTKCGLGLLITSANMVTMSFVFLISRGLLRTVYLFRNGTEVNDTKHHISMVFPGMFSLLGMFYFQDEGADLPFAPPMKGNLFLVPNGIRPAMQRTAIEVL